MLTHTITATITGASRVITVPAFSYAAPDGAGGVVQCTYAGGTVTPGVGDSDPRLDILVAKDDNTIAIVAGTPTDLAAAGVVEAPMPDIPSNGILLLKISVDALAATFADASMLHGRAIDVSDAPSRSEAVSTIAAAGTTETIDLSDGSVHVITLDENVTFTFSNPVATGRASSFTLILRQDGLGTNTVTWPASVKWAGGAAPTITADASAVDVLTFLTVDGGTTWYGFVAGQAMA